MPAEDPKMRPAAKRVIEAMREVRLANREITTRNIAEQLGIKTQTVGANLQKMLREGLIRRHGMVLQFDGGNRAKNMLWRINTLFVRELEKNERSQEVEAIGSPSAMLKVPRGKSSGELSENKVWNAN
jgi:Mn-dependent DtxR family transcriptional regulator